MVAVRRPLPAARRARSAEPTPDATTRALELTWTVIPIAARDRDLRLGLQGLPGHARRRRRTPTRSWSPARSGSGCSPTRTGYVDENLHVPVDTPVRLVMTSEDVIHSFYVPAFRVKQDVVPGPLHEGLVPGDRAGRVPDLLRGVLRHRPLRHAARKVVVHEPGEFETWLERGGELPGQACRRPRPGERLYQHARLRAVPLDRRHGRHRADVQGGLRARRCRSTDGSTVDGRRELHPRVDPRAAGEGRGGVRAGDADLQGAAQGRGDHGDHRVPQDAEVARQRVDGGRHGDEHARAAGTPARTGGAGRNALGGDNYLTHARGPRVVALHARPQADRRDVPGRRSWPRSSWAAIFAMLIRTELLDARPARIMSADTYNQMFTLHGAVMIFLFIIPGIPAALGNFVLPIMLGRQGRGLPAAEPGELLPLGGRGAVLRWSRSSPAASTPAGPSTRPTARPPARASSPWPLGRLHPRLQLDLHRAQLHRHDPQAAPAGHDLVPMPLFLWALYATAIIQVLATPVLGITLLLLIVERALGRRHLRPGARRRPGPLPALLLVLLAPGRLHHDPAGDGRSSAS